MVPNVPGGPHLRTVAMPRDTNASGAIFGGWTLSQMDLAGGTFAAQHAQCRVATVSIEAMRFLRPVEVGDEVNCYCTLERTGDTSVADGRFTPGDRARSRRRLTLDLDHQAQAPQNTADLTSSADRF